MLKTTKMCLLGLLVSGAMLACAGTKTAKKSNPQFDFGKSTTSASLKQAVFNVLHKYNHDVQLLENLIETEWRVITPTKEQELEGMRSVRYRLSINIRNRRSISYATLRVFSEAKFEEDRWEPISPGKDLIEFIQNMQEEVKRDLSRYIPQY